LRGDQGASRGADDQRRSAKVESGVAEPGEDADLPGDDALASCPSTTAVLSIFSVISNLLLGRVLWASFLITTFPSGPAHALATSAAELKRGREEPARHS
jgi:hypothetical protein